MGDNAFSLPTLLLIVPVAGALLTMSMLTRRLAGIMSMVTLAAQAALLTVVGVQLARFSDSAGSATVPGCDQSAAGAGARVVLAQCSEWFPRWGISYDVSVGWAAFGLICLATFVTGVASAFTWWADRPRPAVAHGLLWLTTASLTGLFLARDLVLFYVFFEVMLVPLLILVGVWGAERRRYASLTMFIYTLLGSLPMLVGVVALGMQAQKAINHAGMHDMSRYSLTDLAQLVSDGHLQPSAWILVSFLLAFLIKAPLIPLHGWMPVTYREAPVEVTAVLSGIVSKAAYFGMLVIVLPLFGAQLNSGWGTALTWLALASLVYGCLTAFRQRDMRGVIAYSSLAQMGLIFLGLSAFTGHGASQALGGAYLQSINHGLVSAGMFLLVGIIEHRTGERDFVRLGGLAIGRPRLLSIALVFTLVTLAVPGATTFAGELLILLGVFNGVVAGPLVATIGCVTVIFAAMYALRFIAASIFIDGDEREAPARDFGPDFGAGELAVLLPIVAAMLFMSAWPNVARNAMHERQLPVQITTKADQVGSSADRTLVSSRDNTSTTEDDR